MLIFLPASLSLSLYFSFFISFFSIFKGGLQLPYPFLDPPLWFPTMKKHIYITPSLLYCEDREIDIESDWTARRDIIKNTREEVLGKKQPEERMDV